MDGNGRVDIIDALLVAMYSVDSSVPADHIPNIALGDVDADGDIDFTDAYLIGTYSVNPLDPMLPPGIGQAAPTSVEPDTALSHMYWADANPDKIQRANLDGSNIKNLLPGLESPVGIVLDVTGGKMYWTDRDAGVVQRTNLDGSTTETLITGLETPVGIALDVDGGQAILDGSGRRCSPACELRRFQHRNPRHRSARFRGHRFGCGWRQDILDERGLV